MSGVRDDGYVLGHTPRELDRLDAQGVLYRDVTHAALADAGVEPGMRVLDLGSGSGDVAFLAGEIVGPEGSVVGIERDAGTAASARRGRSPAPRLPRVSWAPAPPRTSSPAPSQGTRPRNG